MNETGLQFLTLHHQSGQFGIEPLHLPFGQAVHANARRSAAAKRARGVTAGTSRRRIGEVAAEIGVNLEPDAYSDAVEAADFLVALRQSAGLTGVDLAGLLDVQPPRIYEVERAAGTRGPTYSFIKRWAQACGADAFLGWRPRADRPAHAGPSGVSRLFALAGMSVCYFRVTAGTVIHLHSDPERRVAVLALTAMRIARLPGAADPAALALDALAWIDAPPGEHVAVDAGAGLLVRPAGADTDLQGLLIETGTAVRPDEQPMLLNEAAAT
jgi:transcriptional regulator with XRE-family HTH domain